MPNSFTEFKQQFQYIIFANFTKEESEVEDVQEFVKIAQIPEWLTIKVAPDVTRIHSMVEANFESSHNTAALGDNEFELLKESSLAKNAIVLSADISDPEDSLDNYIGIVAIIDIILQTYSKCISVVDLKLPAITKPKDWLENVVENLSKDVFEPRDHLIVICTEQENDTFWLRTTGMLKFGKPELSLHSVTDAEIEDNAEFLYDLAAEIIYEDTVPENNTTIELDEIVQPLKAIHMGTYEDKVFGYNLHIELEEKPEKEHLH